MQISIASIRIRKRVRKEVFNVEDLAESMQRHGQLHPIAITSKNVLVSGQRRLEAAKLLGWKTIDAIVLRTDDRAAQLEMELDENIQRSPLTREEIESALSSIDKMRNPGLFTRILRAIVAFFKRIFHGDD
ncbi:MAG TPA: ParB N-terminal domain-containing protein [bacterium]|nr:ParB N-terminal domain-containing protein [bacterium]